MVTKETISALRAKKLSEDFITELEKLIGVSMGNYEYWGIIREIGDKYEIPYNGGLGYSLFKFKRNKG